MPSVVLVLRRPNSQSPQPRQQSVLLLPQEPPTTTNNEPLLRRRRQRRRRRRPPTSSSSCPTTIITPLEPEAGATEEEEEALFVLPSPSGAPLLVGAKGRMLHLVRSQSGLRLALRGLEVFATVDSGPRAPVVAVDALLARQMGVAAYAGGVLRWFSTAQTAREV
jgi:hypothetical protein